MLCNWMNSLCIFEGAEGICQMRFSCILFMLKGGDGTMVIHLSLTGLGRLVQLTKSILLLLDAILRPTVEAAHSHPPVAWLSENCECFKWGTHFLLLLKDGRWETYTRHASGKGTQEKGSLVLWKNQLSLQFAYHFLFLKSARPETFMLCVKCLSDFEQVVWQLICRA